MNSANPSGTTHSRTIPTSQDTAIATLAGMKESKEWAGLFDEEEGERKHRCPATNERHIFVRDGVKFKIKHPVTKRFVSEYFTRLGPKRREYFIVACKCGKRMNEYDWVNSSEVV